MPPMEPKKWYCLINESQEIAIVSLLIHCTMIRLCDLKLDMIANRDCCLRSLYNYTIQEKEMRVLQKPKNVQATEIYTLTK